MHLGSMNYASFGDELRKEREQKQISLGAISDSTRISVKILESIEAGKFSVLPQTYIRAFLRAYGQAIGLDGDDVLRRYDAVNQEIRSVAEEWVSRSRPAAMRTERLTTGTAVRAQRVSAGSIAAAAVILVAVAAIVYLANMGPSLPTQEPLSNVPFDRAVRESEATVAAPESEPPPVVVRSVIDSLRLEVTTSDSVWLSILIDDVRKGEYLFPPGRTRSWAASDRFVITMGNAGSAKFRLNGRELGPLGPRGAIVRNVLITQSGVQQPQ